MADCDYVRVCGVGWRLLHEEGPGKASGEFHRRSKTNRAAGRSDEARSSSRSGSGAVVGRAPDWAEPFSTGEAARGAVRAGTCGSGKASGTHDCARSTERGVESGTSRDAAQSGSGGEKPGAGSG